MFFGMITDMGYNLETITILRKFRKNMGSDLFFEDAKRIFKSNITYLKKRPTNSLLDKKIHYAISNISTFKIFGLVKFVAITGSVGAGLNKDDDIDIFVVVKNGSSWIYRGFLLLKNIFKKNMRFSHQKNVKDLFCINMIYEERGVIFDEDIFNLHELYYMIPIFNEEYFNIILSKNKWVKQYGGVITHKEDYNEKHNIILYGINTFAFFAQYLYMKMNRNKPKFKRLWNNFVDGKIDFFSENFKKKILKKI